MGVNFGFWLISAGPATGLAALLLFGSALAVLAGRPLTIDDAEPVLAGSWEIEAGLRYIREDAAAHFDGPLALTYGVIPRVELGIGFGGQLHEAEEFSGETRAHRGVTDLIIGTKVKLLAAERFWADQSLSMAVKIPTADHRRGLGTGGTDYDVTWITSKTLSRKWGLHFNAGYTWVEDSDSTGLRDLFHIGLAADYAISDKLQLVAEVFASTPGWDFAESILVANGGGRWRVTPNLVLDAAVGGGIYGSAPRVVATCGLTWTFRL